ncbi:MAG: hypothetical protein ABI859_06705 [Pseudomonadota bacterium]
MGPLPATTDDRLIWDTWLAVYRLPVVTVANEVGTFAALTPCRGEPQGMSTEPTLDAAS